MAIVSESLPHLRFAIIEAAHILRISRATLYERIHGGLIATQKDGRRMSCCSTLFTATKRTLGRVTASQIASASLRSFLSLLRYGFTNCGLIIFTRWPNSAKRRAQ
jgi:hypothetical protein